MEIGEKLERIRMLEGNFLENVPKETINLRLLRGICSEYATKEFVKVITFTIQ